MISQNFGSFPIAERTLDIYTAAVCREAFAKHVEPTKKWCDQMDIISEVSCADYRHLVREEPRFVPYFRQATPELELGVLNIGSRPAKRNPKGGVESLRAIPWAFAWAQTRSQLSAWLGVGAGLSADGSEARETLRQMYKEWPWFRETIDLVSMIVSKTDFSISKNYDDQLVDKTGLKFGEEIREKLVQTRQAILDVTESKDVAGAHVALQRASAQIRHPYLDPVNVSFDASSFGVKARTAFDPLTASNLTTYLFWYTGYPSGAPQALPRHGKEGEAHETGRGTKRKTEGCSGSKHQCNRPGNEEQRVGIISKCPPSATEVCMYYSKRKKS